MDNEELYAENSRAAGMRPWAAYIVAALIVCALLAIPGILMAALGWLAGGVALRGETRHQFSFAARPCRAPAPAAAFRRGGRGGIGRCGVAGQIPALLA